MKIPSVITKHTHLILSDGVCNLCSGFAQFVCRRDKRGVFRFAWIQDEISREILEWLQMPTDAYKTIVLIKNGDAYFKSDAFLQIVMELKFPWHLFSIAHIIPLRIRDRIYDWVAANRYRWFGRKEICMIPPDELRDRFISKN